MFLSGEDLFQFFLKMGLKEFLLLEQTWTEGFLLHCWRFYFYSCFFGSPQLAKFHMNPIISTLYWHFSPSSSWANSCCRNETGGKEARHNLWKNDIATCVCAHSLSRVRLWDPMDCSPPGSSVHGIFQSGILEWVAVSSSRGSSWPRIGLETLVSCVGRWILCHCAIWEAHRTRQKLIRTKWAQDDRWVNFH